MNDFYTSIRWRLSGHKQSGFGVEYGMEGLKEFTYAQVITVKHDAARA